MSRTYTILRGTFILTAAGFLSRFIGFFYRIFLSQTFGAEGVGLYQLIFPVYALVFSFTSAGIETTISRSAAAKISAGKEQEAQEFLFAAMSVSFTLSLFAAILLLKNAGRIAQIFLGDIRCVPLLEAMSFAFPFASVHSCIIGYYYGQKKTGIPAAAQLLEQVMRVLSVYLLCLLTARRGGHAAILLAVIGLVFGEICSSVFSVQMLLRSRTRGGRSMRPSAFLRHLVELFRHSTPLTANRILLNLLQNIEAVSIPKCLMLHGSSASEALAAYGILTGMALPCIFFPSAVTNSVSVMLLPEVAGLQTASDRKRLLPVIQKAVTSCFLLGLVCCLGFLLCGNFIGTRLFHNQTAGSLILTLAWICPFLYVNGTLLSIINGLGKTLWTFFFNAAGLLLRIASIFWLIPAVGMKGYLWGLLASQLLVSVLCSFGLSRCIRE